MATNLNALVMKISADTSGLSEGVRLTRSEISRLNRIQQMARTDSDKLRQATEALQKGFAAGAIDAQQMQKGLDEVRRRYGENTKAAKEHADAINRGLAVVKQTEPALEAIKQQFRDLMAAQKAGKVTSEEYARAKQALIDKTKRLKQAEFELSDAGKKAARQQQEAEQQTRRVRQAVEASIPATDRLERQIRELADEYRRGNVTTNEFTRTQTRLQRELRQTRESADRLERDMQRQHRMMIAEQIPGVNRLAGAYAGMGKGATLALGSTMALAAGMALAAKAANEVRKKVAEAMGPIDDTAKASKKLGILTEDLIGLRFAAAEYSGMANGQFDTAMQRMTRRIAEAANGTGEAQDAIKALRLDAKQLADAGPAEAFRQIADRMSQVDSNGERLRLSFKLFDSEGAALVTTLAEGRQALDDMQAAAERLGITFTNVEAAKVEAANDALMEAKAAVDGIYTRLAISMGPTIEAIADDLAKVVLTLRGGSRELDQFSQGLAVSYGLAKDVGEALLAVNAIKNWDFSGAADHAKAAYNMENATQAAIKSAKSLAAAYADAAEFKNSIDTTGIDAGQLSDAQKNIEKEIEALRERNLELSKGAEWYAQYKAFKESMAPEDATPQQRELFYQLQKQNAELEKAAKLEKERLKAVEERIEKEKEIQQKFVDRGNEYLESIKTPLQKLTEELAEAKLAYAQGFINQEQLRNAQAASVKDFRSDERPIKIELPPVLKRDSQEEYRMISQLMTGQRAREQQQHQEAMQIRRANVDAIREVKTALENMETPEAV